jgi:hypothetical protein
MPEVDFILKVQIELGDTTLNKLGDMIRDLQEEKKKGPRLHAKAGKIADRD